MMGKNIRLLFWGAFVLISIVAIQWKKAVITEKQSAKSISILSEKLEHGEPVDVWAVELEDFFSLQSVSLTSLNTAKEAVFYASGQVRDQIKLGATILREINDPAIGVVHDIAREPSLLNGLYKISVKLDSTSLFQDKSFISGNVVLNSRKNSIMVPISSVSLEGDKKIVWVIEKDVAVKKEITVSDSNPQFYRVKSGLELNDLLVVRGNSLLSEGKNVRVRKKVNFKDLASNHGVIQ